MKTGAVTVGHPVDVATGVVHTTHEDLSVPGKVPLTWTRFYSTALIDADRPSPLGLGWHNRYVCSLSYADDLYRFVDPLGAEVELPDPDRTVPKGGVVRNLGAYTELSYADDTLIVCQWDVEEGDVWRYRFPISRGPQGLQIHPLAEIQDPTGQGLSLEYDPVSGRLQQVRQKLERRTLALAYTDDGRVEGIDLLAADRSRHPLHRYHYDVQGRLIAVTDPAGAQDRFEYDRAHRLTHEQTKDGASVRFEYDEQGRCIYTAGLNGYDEKRLRFIDNAGWVEVTDSLGQVRRFQRNADGQILREINPLTAEYQTEYDEHGRIVAKIDPLGAVTRYGYDDQGNRTETVDALGQGTSTTFNAAHLPTAFTDTAGNTWQRSYDLANRLVGIADPEGNRYRLEYDQAGNLVAVVDPLGNRLRQSFNGRGELHAATDWMGQVTRYKSDALGRLVQSTDPLGAPTHYHYDALGRLTGITYADGTRSQYGYDAAGNLTRITDRDGHTTHFEYAPCRRLTKRSGPTGDTLHFGWGSEPARLEAVTNAKGEVYHFEYNAVGWVVAETGFDGRELAFEYDLAGNRIASINGLGERIQFQRDALGRLVAQTLPDGTESRFGYDAAGFLQSAANPDSEIRFERDALGRVRCEHQNGHRLERRYDAASNLTELTSSLGHGVDYRFDPNGLLAELLHRETGDRIGVQRDARGAETQRTLPGGIELHQRFDQVGRLVDQAVIDPRRGQTPGAYPGQRSDQRSGLDTGATLIRRGYRYDKAQLVGIQDHAWGTTTYGYDPAERLLGALREQGASEQFSYDGNDNLTEINRDGEIERLEYAKGDRLIRKGETHYEYDAQGRLVSKIEPGADGEPQVWRYRWDALDQLRGVTNPQGEVWAYAYDPFGRRVEKRAPDGTRFGFVWDEDVVLHELQDDAVKASWAFDPHSFAPLCKFERGEGYSVITDHLGTPREMVDRRGRLVWQVDYYAWGEVREQRRGEVDCPVRFQGQWFDAESGLHYNRFRYYSCNSQIYLTADPYRLNGGFNLYSYSSRPTYTIDPYGLCKDDVDKLVDKLGDDVYFHYTDKAGFDAIIKSGAIRPDSKDRVFLTQGMYKSSETHNALFIGALGYESKGTQLIAIRVKNAYRLLKGGQDYEVIHNGSVRFDAVEVIYTGENPFS